MNAENTILIVDDADINRRILSKILKTEGYRILEAENGRVALDLLTEGSRPVSLLLLDLSMPVMDGFELLAKMNEAGLLTSIPVIVTTSSEQDNAEVRSLECGASDFITKPYNAEVVRHRVKSILRLCENAALINRLETDRLTGVYSREFFYRHVEAMLDENPDEQYDIVCSNIENFKLINSKYGTQAGDELLRYIAKHNIECIGAQGVCGRLGSDTFAVLRKARSLRSQQEIGALYEETFRDAPVKNFVMQYGVYQIRRRGETVAAMCDYAQLALDSIKHKYGLHYAVYDDSMRQRLLREHQLSDYMERALDENQFLVYLQPKHDIETGAVAGAEALVRWSHPELGFIPPGEFIPLFERNGFISKLDAYVWEKICLVMRNWQRNGIALIPVSVNVSRMDFASGDLPEQIGALADRYGIPHEMFHLEVTESAYSDNPQQIIAAVSTLREMGFVIEMDDFGSGYSSLNMLSELPIDILKLDMRFIQKERGRVSDSKRSILSFILGLSKWLQYPTIAEGVETQEEVALLKALGCDYIQGFCFARPMPVVEFERYWAKNRDAQSQRQTADTSAPAAAAEVSTAKRPLVLIVEDIESNRAILTELLAQGFETLSATDGEQAHRIIEERRAEISCILLDLLMPVMDGFQLLELMRRDGSLAEIPVIITSEEGADSELRALRLGAYSFVGKPYNAEILLDHVQKAVHERAYQQLRARLER